MSDEGQRTEVEGERGITPVAGRNRGPLGPLGKVLIVVALIGGIAALLWFTANMPPKQTAEPPAKGPVRQTVAIDEPRAPPPPPAEPPPPTPDRKETPPPRAEGGDPYEESVRAPLIGYQASGLKQPDPAASETGSGDAPSVAAALSGEQEAPTLLDAARRTSKIESVPARRLPDLDLLLTAGTILPCLLETAIDTTAPGYVTCIVPQDIYSASGRVVLLEKGSKVLGEYRAGLRRGQERIFVLWSRAVTPRGVAIDLASSATDALGRAGFDGDVETYFWTRFSSALMVSLVGDLADRGADEIGDGEGRRTQQASDQAVAEALRDSVSIPPVLRKNQGEEVAILLSNDLDFRGVYGLALR